MGGLTVLKAIALTFAGRKPALSLAIPRACHTAPSRGRDTIVRYTPLAAGKLVEIGVKML